MRTHDWHWPQGSPFSPRFSQLSAMASTRASVVLPVPRGPHNRYPCATRPRAIAPRSVLDTCVWTATSAKDLGRYFLARDSNAGLLVLFAGTARWYWSWGLVTQKKLPRGPHTLAWASRGNTPGLTKRRKA